MIKKASIVLSIIFLWVSLAVIAQQQEKPKVDYRSDRTKVTNKGELITLIGNVAFHHNGAIITCDTAYKYADKRFEGRGNVIINSDSTYIYGDRFTYDEQTNTARVYAPLIKTIDKDAILYTHNMEFNTLTNVGSYFGGGTLTQNDNLMESNRGDYYTSTRNIILTGKVEMKNSDYTIMTDSVGFNLDNENVTFYTKTSIWNSKDEYLESYNGFYDRALDLYNFTDSAYVLSKEQETWADSMKYWSKASESELRQNIQIIDTTQKIMAFGNYGHYWGNLKKVIMTNKPAVLSYNPENADDSTFLRADTILVFPMLSPLKDSTKIASTLDSIGVEHNFDKLNFSDTLAVDSTKLNSETLLRDSLLTTQTDSLQSLHIINDSLAINQESQDVNQNKRTKRKRDSDDDKQEIDIKEKPQKEEIDIKEIDDDKKRKRVKKEKPKKERKGWFMPAEKKDTLPSIDSSKLITKIDSTLLDSTVYEKEEEIKLVADSSDFIIKGIRSVKIHKNDIQAICDTIISISLDSTLHMVDSVIIWNVENQITAKKVITYSKNEQMDRAELFEFPIIAQMVDTSRYNQVRGKFIEVFFKNNELDIAYVDGNAQTVYYQEEEEVPVSVLNVTSSSMEISFDSSEMSRIKWLNDYTFSITPLEKLNEKVEVILEGFKWEAEKRPLSRMDIYNKLIRESRRRVIEQMVRPKFELTELIDQEKIKFTNEGIWHDRDEVLPITKEEIILKE